MAAVTVGVHYMGLGREAGLMGDFVAGMEFTVEERTHGPPAPATAKRESHTNGIAACWFDRTKVMLADSGIGRCEHAWSEEQPNADLLFLICFIRMLYFKVFHIRTIR